MARVTFIGGIASISGKIGDVVFRKSASGKTYACKAPQQKRRTPSTKEIQHRQRFAMIGKLVANIMADPTQRAVYEQLQNSTPGAKTMTLRKFVYQKISSVVLKEC